MLIPRPRPGPYRSLPPAVFTLLIVNVLAFGLQGRAPALVLDFALWPLGSGTVRGAGQVGFEIWQLVSYSFLHGNLTHLFFNLFALWMFGSQIEVLWGTRAFLFYYFTCVIGAALVQLVVIAAQDVFFPTIGASGGVFGILLAFGLMFPNRQIMLLFPPIPMRAKYFVLLYGVLELTLGVSGAQTQVAHFAHLGGMFFGFLLIRYWLGRFPFSSRPSK